APGLLEQHADGRYQAKQLEIHAPEQAAVYAMPVLSTFAGADITAGIMATRLHRVTETVLLLDLGTTSKAVLHHRGRLYAIGLADTPAFDGAGILFGRSPETGSIDHVRIDGDLQITVVGESLPRGISGGGLIELAGELRRTGLLDDCGRLSGAAVPAADRILEIKKDRAFLLYRDDGEFETDIYVTQADIGLLLQAKTAAGAMVNRLLDHAGIGADALDKVLLGGPFGEKLQVQAFFDLGLFPGVLQGRVACVGNTVKKGTQMALIDRNVLQEAERLIHKVETLPF
ncbi:MAG: ATP-binding protein, partial [Deltaproteobacteria bacterium]|nr:ATP-binding protein [Deltaproteobacteria bacterium]